MPSERAAGRQRTPAIASYRHAALKQAAALLRLMYYAYGREDFVVRNAGQLKATLDKYGTTLTRHETGGGHTWINWREHLNDLAPRRFK